MGKAVRDRDPPERGTKESLQETEETEQLTSTSWREVLTTPRDPRDRKINVNAELIIKVADIIARLVGVFFR